MLARVYLPNVSTKSLNMHRKNVLCNSNNKRIFEIHSNSSDTKLELVRDAYEACHHLSGDRKEACYLVFGLDGKNVERYLPVVEKFERAYHKKYTKYEDLYVCHLDPVKPPKILKLGPFKFTIERE